MNLTELAAELASLTPADRDAVFRMVYAQPSAQPSAALGDPHEPCVVMIASRADVFAHGGGNVINNSQRIGSKNAEFIRKFLKSEGYRIVSEDLEGTLPRRIHYYPDTGKVMMRKLHRKDDLRVVEEETRYRNTIAAAPVEGDIDLF